MITQKIIQPSLLLFILLLFCSCQKADDEPTGQAVNETITMDSFSDVTETSFKVIWSSNSSDLKSISIEISLEQSFNVLEKVVEIENISQTSFTITQLNGATKYYCRLRAVLENGNSLMSESKIMSTSYKTDMVSFTTSDGIEIVGELKYLENMATIKPGIIFMHELGATTNNWRNSDVVISLVAQDYACLIIDFRGHSQSGDFPLPTSYAEVEPFINEVSKDLIAALEFMKSNEVVNGDNTALVGASLGGIIAIAGNAYDEVKTSVAVSASQLGIYSIFPALEINSAFYIAAELDANLEVNFADEATKMYNKTEGSKKLTIINGSAEHGTKLLNLPSINEDIINWINSHLQE